MKPITNSCRYSTRQIQVSIAAIFFAYRHVAPLKWPINATLDSVALILTLLTA